MEIPPDAAVTVEYTCPACQGSGYLTQAGAPYKVDSGNLTPATPVSSCGQCYGRGTIVRRLRLGDFADLIEQRVLQRLRGQSSRVADRPQAKGPHE